MGTYNRNPITVRKSIGKRWPKPLVPASEHRLWGDGSVEVDHNPCVTGEGPVCPDPACTPCSFRR